jgi:hypothetical protein
MKTRALPAAMILFVLLLSACSANANSTEEPALDSICTAAASTLSAQEILSMPTPTTTMPGTSTPLLLPTPAPTMVTPQNVVVSYSPASTAKGCNDATYVSDVTIPDGTVLAPGESFAKTWKFQNTGTCTWTEDYQITFVSGTEMDGDAADIDQEVAAGDPDDISVVLVAPNSEGTFTGYWRLADENGNLFGQSVYVMIVVSEDAATSTPASTVTTEATSTTKSSSTPTPAAVPTTYP